MRSIATNGIIIRKRPIGEHDLRITIFSPHFGQIEATAKGARKIAASFSGNLETMNVCDFQLHKTPRSYTITQCNTTNCWSKIKNSFSLSLPALLIMDIFTKLSHTPDRLDETYHLLLETLKIIGTKTISTDFIISAFKIKIMQLNGVMPDISRCSNCIKRWQTETTITQDQSGALFCSDCDKTVLSKNEIEFRLIKLIKYISDNPITVISLINCPHEIELSLNKISSGFLDLYLPFSGTTETIINQMKITQFSQPV